MMCPVHRHCASGPLVAIGLWLFIVAWPVAALALTIWIALSCL